MYCSHCGNQISDDSRFCPVCGVALEKPAEERKETTEQQNTANTTTYTTYTNNSTYYQNGNGYAPQTTNILAVVGFILSFFSPLIGFILSIIGLNQINKNPNQKGKGLAIAGIVIAVLMGVVSLVCYSTIFAGVFAGTIQ